MFDENKDEDHFELSHRLNDIKAEMEYPLRKCCYNLCHFRTLLNGNYSALCAGYLSQLCVLPGALSSRFLSNCIFLLENI